MPHISNETFINAHIKPLTESIAVASVQFFVETGHISGSLNLALNKLCDDIREDERSRIELERLSKNNLPEDQSLKK